MHIKMINQSINPAYKRVFRFSSPPPQPSRARLVLEARAFFFSSYLNHSTILRLFPTPEFVLTNCIQSLLRYTHTHTHARHLLTAH